MNNITTQRIRELAEEQGRSLKYLCDRIGVKSRTYFQDIEKQGRNIPMDKLKIIADALDTTTDYLLGEIDIKHKTPQTHLLKDEFTSLIDSMSTENLLKLQAIIEEKIKNRQK